MPEEAADKPEDAVAAQPAKTYPIYAVDELNKELRQGEVITDLAQYTYNAATNEIDEIVRPFAIVLTQDCDLLWDFEAKAKEEIRDLNGVLVFEAEPAPDVRAKIAGSDIWRRIIQNRDERYHLLEAVPPELDLAGIGLPSLVIDFKRFFTLGPDEIYRQCADAHANRRCRLEMPYREHLQTRAAFYFQRVMLPEPHKYVAPTST
jgi:hypothetical protein